MMVYARAVRAVYYVVLSDTMCYRCQEDRAFSIRLFSAAVSIYLTHAQTHAHTRRETKDRG